MSATLSPGRAAWRHAVATIAAKAHEKLPACSGRIDAAVKLVLAGDIELLPEGGAHVASRPDASVTYHLVNGHCDCTDYPKAPSNLCAHRLAYGIARRAAELTPPVQEPLLLPPPLPEAPASVNVHLELAGRQIQLTLRDRDEGRLLARLDTVLQRFPLPEPSTSVPPRAEGWCSKHGVQMTQNHKNGRSWWSHKTTDGWCKAHALPRFL
jgi:hypothetical protein